MVIHPVMLGGWSCVSWVNGVWKMLLRILTSHMQTTITFTKPETALISEHFSALFDPSGVPLVTPLVITNRASLTLL